MRRRLDSGSSLIEVLTVIVVFLVGILALVQAFPTGLGIVRATRSNSLASTLARAEMQRLESASDILPDMVVPVIYRPGGVIEVNANVPRQDLMPEADTVNGGQIDQDGNVIVGGSSVGKWDKISGANKFNRIIGEGRPVPAPRTIGSELGSLIQLQFAPIYYSRSTSSQVGVPGILSVYGNDLNRRYGDPDNGRPNPDRAGRGYEFFFVDSETAQNAPFAGEDQIWVPVARTTSNAAVSTPLRVSLAFGYDEGGTLSQHEVIVVVDPATAGSSVLVNNGNWLVLNLRNLIAEPGIYGPSGFDPAKFTSADGESVRVQRAYQEIPLAQAFQSGNPYEFKALNDQLGAILLNPSASQFKIQTPLGVMAPLEAKVDYTVLDWRNLRDGFRIPTSSSWPTLRLALGGIKSMSTPGIDNLPYTGLGAGAPDGDNTVAATDFLLIDDETGGVILGNKPGATYHSYFVDKRNGVITFVDRDVAPGVQIYLSLPDGAGGWAAPTLVEASGRAVRAVYQANGEWAIQPDKPASSYRLTAFLGASGLQAGECLVGATPLPSGPGVGQASRLYFPISDLGHRVIVNEIRCTDGSTRKTLRDQEFRIDTTETFGGITLACARIEAKAGAGFTFDHNTTGYAVKGVKGASVKVRVFWNPARFSILQDLNDNFNQLERWMRETRRVEAEGFVTAGELK